MLRSLRSRRRPHYGAQLCAVISALLLLLSVSLLHNRLSSSQQQRNDAVAHHLNDHPLRPDFDDVPSTTENDDGDDDDKIDELDDDNNSQNDDLFEGEVESNSNSNENNNRIKRNGFYMDEVSGSIRRHLNKKSIDDWDFDYGSSSSLFSVGVSEEDKSKAAFGSDDVPVDKEVRRKLGEVEGIEDALLLKVVVGGGKRVSPLREGWGDWFDKKGDFLRRDRMFKSNLDVLNPLNNPLLQDPDGVGVGALTRGDKAVMKVLLNEFKKTPFLVKKTLSVLGMEGEGNVGGKSGVEEFVISRKREESGLESRSEIKRAERRTLDQDLSNGSDNERRGDVNGNSLNKDGGRNFIKGDDFTGGSDDDRVKGDNGDRNSGGNENLLDERGGGGEIRKMGGADNRMSKVQLRKSEELNNVMADGRRWGYFPGLHPHLSFSDFMDSFFRKGKCGMKVFTVWNSPPWMYSVRHQRGLESLLSQHRDACVVVFSETMNLDFFKNSFVKDG